MNLRKPIVAGQFYPADKLELKKAIEDSFLSVFGPKTLSFKKRTKKILAVISPHAGYSFSGACAAHAFKEIAESKFPDTYIILGVNHSSHITCTSDEDWKTPFGTVKCDLELVKKLSEKKLLVDNRSHAHEHSIEVQLPFLQYVFDENLDDLKIVPIMIADDNFEKWGKIIVDSISELKRNVVFICSSDFTHYGYDYGYVPFDSNVKTNLVKLDKGALDFIENIDPKGFLSYVDKTGATICGRCGIAVLLGILKNMKNNSGTKKNVSGKVLKYYTSGDVLKNYDSAVGYAAVKFE